MEDHCNQQQKSNLHFKQVCGQCGYEIRVHRKSYDTTRAKRFDNLESFLEVLDTFERLHDLVNRTYKRPNKPIQLTHSHRE